MKLASSISRQRRQYAAAAVVAVLGCAAPVMAQGDSDAVLTHRYQDPMPAAVKETCKQLGGVLAPSRRTCLLPSGGSWGVRAGTWNLDESRRRQGTTRQQAEVGHEPPIQVPPSVESAAVDSDSDAQLEAATEASESLSERDALLAKIRRIQKDRFRHWAARYPREHRALMKNPEYLRAWRTRLVKRLSKDLPEYVSAGNLKAAGTGIWVTGLVVGTGLGVAALVGAMQGFCIMDCTGKRSAKWTKGVGIAALLVPVVLGVIGGSMSAVGTVRQRTIVSDLVNQLPQVGVTASAESASVTVGWTL